MKIWPLERSACRGGFSRRGVASFERLGLGHARAGFTLLELLLAAGIASFVLAALLTSINFVARVEQASTDKLELARLANSIFMQLERDLGAIVVVAETTEESDLLVEADEQMAAAEESTQLSVFVGDDVTLAIVCEPVVSLTEVMTEISEWQVQGAEWDGGSGPRRRVVTWGVDVSAADELPPLRLSTILSSDGLTGLDVGRISVPEAVSMTFAYFSEGEWLDAVDDYTDGFIPSAIRVQLVLQTVDGDGELIGEEYLAERVFAVAAGRGGTASTDEEEL